MRCGVCVKCGLVRVWRVVSWSLLCRDALILGVSEKEAKDHFHSKLHEARKNAKFTVMNWFLHGIAKDNR